MLTLEWRIWIERDGQPCFGDGRARLLEAIGRAGSLSGAARELEMPYRTAWQHLESMEQALGRRLVERQTGGKRGGGTQLTDHGQELLAAYRRLRTALDRARDRHVVRFFEELQGAGPAS